MHANTYTWSVICTVHNFLFSYQEKAHKNIRKSYICKYCGLENINFLCHWIVVSSVAWICIYIVYTISNDDGGIRCVISTLNGSIVIITSWLGLSMFSIFFLCMLVCLSMTVYNVVYIQSRNSCDFGYYSIYPTSEKLLYFFFLYTFCTYIRIV